MCALRSANVPPSHDGSHSITRTWMPACISLRTSPIAVRSRVAVVFDSPGVGAPGVLVGQVAQAVEAPVRDVDMAVHPFPRSGVEGGAHAWRPRRSRPAGPAPCSTWPRSRRGSAGLRSSRPTDRATWPDGRPSRSRRPTGGHRLRERSRRRRSSSGTTSGGRSCRARALGQGRHAPDKTVATRRADTPSTAYQACRPARSLPVDDRQAM